MSKIHYPKISILFCFLFRANQPEVDMLGPRYDHFVSDSMLYRTKSRTLVYLYSARWSMTVTLILRSQRILMEFHDSKVQTNAVPAKRQGPSASCQFYLMKNLSSCIFLHLKPSKYIP